MKNDDKITDIERAGFKVFQVLDTTTPRKKYLAVSGNKLIFGTISNIHKQLYGY